MIAIIDYGMGNLRSVQKAIENVGGQATVTEDPRVIQSAEKIVLPGVGAMQPAMEKLQALGLVPIIKKVIDEKKPFLGICLGLQLLFEKSEEGGNVAGLGILAGEVKRFTQLKVPHMGWNRLKLANAECPLWSGINSDEDVYFCHSYYVVPKDAKTISATTDYGKDFVSAIWKDNLCAVQFHPEKSQRVGLKILENFVKL
ncbi:MAG: imidazole glycerol phosphate synthase subunit HisH [Candidatus Omnitrophica bacterium]|nr:imidazole glycerol phosphate synthase subunit HisH [Candidatus Omnitrophota bacterium]